MGGQCSSTRSMKEDYEFICEETHPTFGPITRIRVTVKEGQIYRQELACRVYSFESESVRNAYIGRVESSQSYENIPTLIMVHSWEKQGFKESKTIANTCMNSFKLKLYFQYHKNTLYGVMSRKKREIRAHAKPELSPFCLLPPQLKLNDYPAIDRLTQKERKQVNCYYQEVEILRMIDHVIGALYFLNHMEHTQDAVNPNHIMVDDEGKFILADAQIFRLHSNYQIALTEHAQNSIPNHTHNHARNHAPSGEVKIKRKSDGMRENGGEEREEEWEKRKIFRYLPPELLKHVKHSHSEHCEDSGKSEIFSVGMIALHMCLIDCFENSPILDWENLKLNRNELNKSLLLVRSRYSGELVQLLMEMLEYDPFKRINYNALIDKLNPLLSANLEIIQRIYSQNDPNLSMSVMSLSGRAQGEESFAYSNQLIRKLNELESSYQKIINNRVMYDTNKPSEEAIKADEKKILKQLRKINRVANDNPNHNHSHNNNHNSNQNNNHNSKTSASQCKREVRGTELYEIYLSEYQTIKKNRIR